METHLRDPDLVDVLQVVREEHASSGIQQSADLLHTLWRLAARSLSEPSLLACESHVLDVHREQCAESLRRAALAALVSGVEEVDYFHLGERQRRIVGHGLSEQRRGRLRTVLRESGHDEEARLLDAPPQSRIDTTRLALRLSLAGRALAPSWKADVYASRALTGLGQFEAAAPTLEGLAKASAGSVQVRYYAKVGLGVLQAARGDHPAAMRAYRDASTLAPRPSAAMNYFALACTLGEVEESKRAARILDELPTSSWIPLPTPGDRRAGGSAMTVVRKIEDRLGVNSKRIADALLQTAS